MSELPPHTQDHENSNETYNSIQSRTVFVGDLSYFCNEQHLRELYSPFGQLEMVQIKSTKAGEPHLAYGFVRFQHSDAALRAIQSTDGFIMLGRAIRVALAADSPNQKLPGFTLRSGIAKDVPTAQIHISFKAINASFLVTEMTLRDLYQQYGEIVDVTVKKSKFDQFHKIQTGYGFVHYPLTDNGIISAKAAIQYTNSLSIQGITFECSFSRGLEEYLITHSLSAKPFNTNPHQNNQRTVAAALSEPYHSLPTVNPPAIPIQQHASMMYSPGYPQMMPSISIPNHSNYINPPMNYPLPAPIPMYPYPSVPTGYPVGGMMPSSTSSSPMSANTTIPYGNYYPSRNDRMQFPAPSSEQSHLQQWPNGYPYPDLR